MLTICYSPKGGQGCTTVTAALAFSDPAALLIDTAGDLPAVAGIPEPHGPGITDMLASTRPIDTTVLDALTVDAGPARLIPSGSRPAGEVPSERWGELAAVLDTFTTTVFIDAGTGPAAAAIPGRRFLVVRACYLALRRATQSSLRPDGVILVAEPGRALTAADVESTLAVPVVAEVPIDPSVARAIDAGLFASRCPRQLLRALAPVTEPAQAHRG